MTNNQGKIVFIIIFFTLYFKYISYKSFLFKSERQCVVPITEGFGFHFKKTNGICICNHICTLSEYMHLFI